MRKPRPLAAGIIYFDPPFYYKADKLYSFFFDEAQHRRLHDALGSLGQHWLLSTL